MTKEEKIENIKKFLEGSHEQKYITAIEYEKYGNDVSLVIDDPERGKYVETYRLTPFTFIKDFKKYNKSLYNGDKEYLKKSMASNGITVSQLRTDNHPRLEYGFKFKVTAKDSSSLMNFFKNSGYNHFKDPDRLFFRNEKDEQYLISSGKRLFKGYTKYSDLHKFYFDIETTSLKGSDGFIFLIGMKDNRGFNKVLSIDLNNPIETERNMIIEFFETIVNLKPAIIAGYNSEAFDFTFILDRAKILGIELGTKLDGELFYDVRTSLNPNYPLKREESTLKFGGETEKYEKTLMWGMNVIDISHSVRATKAINSDIKSWNLKYICKYKGYAKPNRMYVKGDEIYKTWNENKKYYINKENNSFNLIPIDYQDKADIYIDKLKNIIKKCNNLEDKLSILPVQQKICDFFGCDENNVGIITGSEIIYQYLLDDLYETEMVDEGFNQANFMMGGILPTNCVRGFTMGNASKWKLLMTTYSYENNLAIPTTDRKRDIVGGLSRLFRTGFAANVLKMDYSSLYPSIQLTHDVFPTLDITGIMESMLHYFRDGRNEYKNLHKKHEKLFKQLGNLIDKELSQLYDTKQLPIKILANSQFGALSSPAIFNWGDNSIGEMITCTGRQYLRLMVYHFMKYGFLPIVLDTDGVNFSIPNDSENIIINDKNGVPYKGKRTDKDGIEEEYIKTGYEAVLAEFNDIFMTGVMGLSLDGLYGATINISRKNYADLYLDGSVKLVGNSLKDSNLQGYIEKVINEGVNLLLNNKGKEFIELYYWQLERIYNKQIPLMQIASRSKVKEKVKDYQYDLIHKKNKNGKPISKKAYMELLIANNLDPDLGKSVYYVNNGKAKSHSDVKYSYLIDENDFISNPDKTGDYNVAKYIDIYNKKISMFLVCFGENVRDTLIVTNPEKRCHYTDKEVELISGVPMSEFSEDLLNYSDIKNIEVYNELFKDEDVNEPLFEMSEREIKFWNYSDKDPKDIFPHFTTHLSNIKLFTKEEKEKIKEEKAHLTEIFKAKNVVTKHEYDFLLNGDAVLKYTNKFIIIERKVKDGKETAEEKEIIELDDYSWVLSKFENGFVEDIEVIEKEIYL